MKILLVTPYFYPKVGGLENYAYNIAKELQNKYKWTVVVVTSNHKEKKDIKEKIEGITIYRLAPWFKLSNTPINPLWYFKMRKIIQKEKPSIINAHTPVPFIAEISALAAKNIPFVLTYHALSLYKHGFSPFNIIVWLYKQTENYLFYKAEKIIVVSEYIKEKFSENLKQKVLVVTNSIKKSEMHKVTSDNEKENIILFTSSLDKTHDWKGLNPLLHAIKKFIDAYGRQVTLIVIGEGNAKKDYIQLTQRLGITNNVSFVGLKVGKEKNQYFNKAKIAVVYPSTSNDALPTFLLEAWAYSLPVIGSDILPLSKIIKTNFNGLLIQPNRPKDLANAINLLLTKSTLRKKLLKGGYQTVISKYIFEDQLRTFNTILMGVK